MPEVSHLQWDLTVNAGEKRRGDMAQALIKSDVIHWSAWSGSLHLQWTGTPAGTITVFVCNDHKPGGAALNGTWRSINARLTPAIVQPAGAASDEYIELDGLRAAYLRVEYARTSGAGALTGQTEQARGA